MAVLLACATAPLLWIGANVTSLHAGMAVPDWPTTYGYNLFLYPWQTWIYGPLDLFVEHGHRLFGALVGMLTIGMLAAVWLKEDRGWVKRLALLALGLVIVQGVLGGLRVVLDARTIALAHGVTGPLFFVMAVTMATVTSRWWREAPPAREEAGAGRLHRLAVATTLVAYIQLVLGAFVRHVPDGADPSTFRMLVMFHLTMAAVVTIHIGLVAMRVMRGYRSEPRLRRPTLALLALVGVQLLLGCATWVTHYGVPSWIADNQWSESFTVEASGLWQVQITNFHVLTGSLIVATAAVVSLRSMRLVAAKKESRPSPAASAYTSLAEVVA